MPRTDLREYEEEDGSQGQDGHLKEGGVSENGTGVEVVDNMAGGWED